MIKVVGFRGQGPRSSFTSQGFFATFELRPGSQYRQHSLADQGKSRSRYMLKESVETALEEIRPALRADGGDVELVEVTEDGVVTVKLTGACHGCPMGMQTLKMGIETHLKQKVPEVSEVLGV